MEKEEKNKRIGFVRCYFECEYYKTQTEIRRQIQACEGKHMQQVVYSTYHDALTQICFDCKKIRTNIKNATKKTN